MTYPNSIVYLNDNEPEEREKTPEEIRERRRKIWSKYDFEETYGKGSYKKVLNTIKTGKY